MTQRHIATCEIGFWRPTHEGCPKCGPDGPCINPAYEKLTQWQLQPWWRRLFSRRPVA